MKPKKLTQLERDMLEECARTHEAIHPGPLLAHIAAVEAERDEARAQVATARSAALEEAAKVCDTEDADGPYEIGTAAAAATSIRALATTPPPPVVPVAKVRMDEDAIVAAALRLGMGKVTRGQLLDFVRVLVLDLGINLDGKS